MSRGTGGPLTSMMRRMHLQGNLLMCEWFAAQSQMGSVVAMHEGFEPQASRMDFRATGMFADADAETLADMTQPTRVT